MHNQLHHDPPRTLAERLEQLNDNLQSLGERLKDAIAGAVSAAVAAAIHDALRHLLGSRDGPNREHPFIQRSDFDNGLCYEADESLWHQDDGFQPQLQDTHAQRQRTPTPKRFRNALGLALTTMWWLRQLPCRRPVLTTVAVAVAAGITAFLAGPTLAAGVGVLATTASLFLRANAAGIASVHLSSLLAG
jgi:hypothetical protein